MSLPASLRAALLASLLGLGLGLGSGLAPAGEGDEGRARAMLAAMNRALGSMDYEGTLVHLQGNRLATLHLVHRLEGGRVQERLVSLSGPVRAVTREQDRVTCLMPDGHPLFVKSQAGRNLMGSARIDPSDLRQRYELQIEGTARVAGKDTDVLTIKPRDGLRYGYRLHLDRESGLPLKSDLIDQSGEPIEQLMFTTLVLHGDGEQVQAPASPQPASPSASGLGDPGAARWRFEPRPPGFEPVLYDVLQGPNGTDVEHFVFSDRLSAYSIYIEADTTGGLDGVTRIGAAHAAGRRVDGHQITAVGEVPSATVEAALAGVHARAGGAP